MEAVEELHYVTPVDPERLRRLREEARRSWAALSEDQRKARRDAIAVRKAELRASPRRVVGHTRAENGDIVLERADGSHTIIRRIPAAGGPSSGNG